MSSSISYLGEGIRLTLDNSWEHVPTPDPEQLSFLSPDEAIALVISSMVFNMDPSRVPAMAEELYRSRTKAEHKYTFEVEGLPGAVDDFQHSEPVYLEQDGFLILLYRSTGRDDLKAVFCGMFRSDILINLYASSQVHDFDVLEQTIQSLFGGLQIQPPPS